MKCSASAQLTGRRGEDAAAGIYQSAGYAILARNWRFGHLELDLICEREGEIVFVEVKTRAGRGFGGASGAVTPEKRKKLIAAAKGWLLRNGRWSSPCRFDIVCLYGSGENFALEHIPDAFSATLDSGNTHWQY